MLIKETILRKKIIAIRCQFCKKKIKKKKFAECITCNSFSHIKCLNKHYNQTREFCSCHAFSVLIHLRKSVYTAEKNKGDSIE